MLRDIYEIVRDAIAIFLFGMVVLAIAFVAIGAQEGIIQ